MRHLTARELAERAGVSASLVSQIENGKTDPSVMSLRRLARVLDTPIAELFVDGAGPAANDVTSSQPLARIVRRGRRRRLELPESRLVYELLTPDLRGPIEFLWVQLEPDHEPVESMSHPGFECALVLEGTMHLVIGDEEYVLEAGDCVTIDSSIPHRIENRGTERVVQVSAITPPSL